MVMVIVPRSNILSAAIDCTTAVNKGGECNRFITLCNCFLCYLPSRLRGFEATSLDEKQKIILLWPNNQYTVFITRYIYFRVKAYRVRD